MTLQEGSADIGGTRAAMAMIVAETLGLSADQVNPMVVDTDSIGYTDGTGGSRVCYATGHACYLAAENVKEKMRVRAARLLEVEEEEVEFENGGFVCKSDSNKGLTFNEVAAEQGSTGGPIEGTGAINASGPGNAFATHAVDVEVDSETGKVRILRYTAAQDVGKAIHPSYVEGQIQGGVVQGIGWALTEGYFYGEDCTMGESDLPRLPHADHSRPADGRLHTGGGEQPCQSARDPRCRGGSPGSSDGGDRQRHLRRCRRSPPRTADEPRPGRGCPAAAFGAVPGGRGLTRGAAKPVSP